MVLGLPIYHHVIGNQQLFSLPYPPLTLICFPSLSNTPIGKKKRIFTHRLHYPEVLPFHGLFLLEDMEHMNRISSTQLSRWGPEPARTRCTSLVSINAQNELIADWYSMHLPQGRGLTFEVGDYLLFEFPYQ